MFCRMDEIGRDVSAATVLGKFYAALDAEFGTDDVPAPTQSNATSLRTSAGPVRPAGADRSRPDDPSTPIDPLTPQPPRAS